MNLHQGTYLQGGRYRIDGVLGQGGFGITYSATQVALDIPVAIKEFFMKDFCNRDESTSQVIVPSSGGREYVERFRHKFIKEAQNIAKLKHANIVSVIDVFEENGTAYYVMEYFGGGSLADKVRNGALPESEAVRYISQVADALALLHGKRMMHLDIKPANILLDDNDNAVLIDFGLAKQYDSVGLQTSTTPVGISHGYAPIEQYKRGGVSNFSPATDIYSLGATLYKLVTGQTPPDASDIGNDGLPVLPQEISAPVREAIETAMEFRIKDRPQSVAEFLKLLENGGKSKDERGKSKEETLLNSSSTPRGEVSRSDGGESEPKGANAKSKTESFDNTSSDKSCAVQTQFAPHGSRPASVVKAERFDNVGSDGSQAVTTELEPCGSRPTSVVKAASPDNEETVAGVNPPRLSATPLFEKVGELSITESENVQTASFDDEATCMNGTLSVQGCGDEETHLNGENGIAAAVSGVEPLSAIDDKKQKKLQCWVKAFLAIIFSSFIIYSLLGMCDINVGNKPITVIDTFVKFVIAVCLIFIAKDKKARTGAVMLFFFFLYSFFVDWVNVQGCYSLYPIIEYLNVFLSGPIYICGLYYLMWGSGIERRFIKQYTIYYFSTYIIWWLYRISSYLFYSCYSYGYWPFQAVVLIVLNIYLLFILFKKFEPQTLPTTSGKSVVLLSMRVITVLLLALLMFPCFVYDSMAMFTFEYYSFLDMSYPLIFTMVILNFAISFIKPMRWLACTTSAAMMLFLFYYLLTHLGFDVYPTFVVALVLAVALFALSFVPVKRKQKA